MKYKILQIKLTETQIDIINSKGHDAVHKQVMRLNLMDNDQATIADLAAKALKLGYYTHVANIEADDLDAVFDIGNIGPEECIERINRMHSISVGDVIVDENGVTNVVASLGFERIKRSINVTQSAQGLLDVQVVGEDTKYKIKNCNGSWLVYEPFGNFSSDINLAEFIHRPEKLKDKLYEILPI
jgi:hypothetical protein